MAKNNVKRFLLLFALGVAYGFMYVMPYMKSSFYDQMIAAMGCTNAQLGSLMTYYTIALTASYPSLENRLTASVRIFSFVVSLFITPSRLIIVS